jgi:hypothetical protein
LFYIYTGISQYPLFKEGETSECFQTSLLLREECKLRVLRTRERNNGRRRKFHNELHILTLHIMCEGYKLKEDKLVDMKHAWKN